MATEITLDQVRDISLDNTVSGPQEIKPEEMRDLQPHEIPFSEVPLKALKSIPNSAYNMAKDVAGIVRHPLKSAVGLGSLASSITPGTYGIEGVAGPDNEQQVEIDKSKSDVRNSVKAAVLDRYGSWNNVKKTISEDPIGFLMDISPVLGGAGGVVKGATKLIVKESGVAGTKAASVAAKTADVLGAASKATNPANLVTTLPDVARTSSATELYKSALKKAKLEPDELNKAVGAGLKEGIPVTEKGMMKLSDRIKKLNNDLNDVFSDQPIYKSQTWPNGLPMKRTGDEKVLFPKNPSFKNQPTIVDTNPPQIIATESRKMNGDLILAKLENKKLEEMAPRLESKAKVYEKAYNNAIADVKKKLDKNGLITTKDAQDIKTTIYKDLKKSYEKDFETDVSKVTDKFLAKTIKESLEKQLKDGVYVNRKTGEIVPGYSKHMVFKDGIIPSNWEFKNYSQINKNQEALRALEAAAQDVISSEKNRAKFGGLLGQSIGAGGLTGFGVGSTAQIGALSQGGLAVASLPVFHELMKNAAFKSKLAIMLNMKGVNLKGVSKGAAKVGYGGIQAGRYGNPGLLYGEQKQ